MGACTSIFARIALREKLGAHVLDLAEDGFLHLRVLGEVEGQSVDRRLRGFHVQRHGRGVAAARIAASFSRSSLVITLASFGRIQCARSKGWTPTLPRPSDCR